MGKLHPTERQRIVAMTERFAPEVMETEMAMDALREFLDETTPSGDPFLGEALSIDALVVAASNIVLASRLRLGGLRVVPVPPGDAAAHRGMDNVVATNGVAPVQAEAARPTGTPVPRSGE